MTWLAGPQMLLLLAFCHHASSDKDLGTLVVNNARAIITAADGESVPLTCKAEYDFNLCSHVRVAWCQYLEKDLCDELRNPRKYLTTVNETVMHGGRRRRQVVTEIHNLTSADYGDFQCNASCENGQAATGHIITIEGKPSA